MRSFLQTRGFAQQDDYMFVGREPDERWWEAYGRYNSTEKRSLITWSDGSRWRVLISGIPTSRRDVVNTPIRSMLVLDGQCRGRGDATVEDDLALVGLLVDVWLDDEASGGRRLADRLDAEFPEDGLPDLLVGDDPDVWHEVDKRVHAVLRDLEPQGAAPPAAKLPRERGPWFVGSRSEQAHRARLARAARSLLAGRPGVGAYLNLLRTTAYAQDAAHAIAGLGAGSVLLLTDLLPRELPGPKGAGPLWMRPWLVVLLIALGLGFLVAVIWLVTRRR